MAGGALMSRICTPSRYRRRRLSSCVWCAEWGTALPASRGILSRDKVREACCAGWVCDPGRARRELGFCATTGLEEGLRLTLAWYKEAGWLKF